MTEPSVYPLITPIHDCDKGEGKCRLKVTGDKNSACIFKAESCKYRVVKQIKTEDKPKLL